MSVLTKKPVRRKSDTERRSEILKLLATAEERDRFQAAADKAGMSLSTWLRWIAIEATNRMAKPNGS
jgi:hypothetical protein